ncbi:MAG: hypothetical protein KI790_12785, partial [Cyclobacteriaceae bacterium]|nr:hypothetical protein [Cyclobacteriaceae bacterium HetDA_MAG_MS6]
TLGGTGNLGLGILANDNYRARMVIPNTNTTTEYGIRVDNDYSGTGTTYGVYADMSLDGSGAKNGFFTNVDHNGSAAAYGFRATMDHDGTSNSYGLYLSNVGSTSGIEYGIYSTGEVRNYLSGDLGIGATAPSAKLDVVGATELNGSLATPASGTTTVSGVGQTLAKPSRRIVRIQASSAGRSVEFIGEGDDGQEVILVNVGNIFIEVTGSNTIGGVGSLPTNAIVMADGDPGLNTVPHFDLRRGSTLHLIYDSTLGYWVEVSRSFNYDDLPIN